MRSRTLIRCLILLSVALLLLALRGRARADGIASAQAQAMAGYATPQAALATQAYGTCQAAALAAPAMALAPAYGTCNVAAAAAPLATYVQPQAVVVQRQFVPQAVYVQPQAAIVQRQVYAAPVVQQAIVTPYVPQVQALAQVNSYGTVGAQNGLLLNRGAGRVRAQRTVSRSKAVTVTGRPGLLNRVLGR